MKRVVSHFRQASAAILLIFAAWSVSAPAAESTRFERVSEHCHYMRLDGGNVAVVVGADGVLMVNPPDGDGLDRVREALGRLSAAPVRWLAFTEPRYVDRAGTRYYAGLGAQLVGSRNLHRLFVELNGEETGPGQPPGGRGLPDIGWERGTPGEDRRESWTLEAASRDRAAELRGADREDENSAPGAGGAEGWTDRDRSERRGGEILLPGAARESWEKRTGDAGPMEPGHVAPSGAPLAWFLFDESMRIYPGGLEVQIFALGKSARSGGDVVLHLPGEKVLLVGDLYESARYPEIDIEARGDASGWFEGMAEVIEAVPLLMPSIARNQPKEGTTLAEGVAVVSSRDVPSNLQNMKDLLEDCRKLRREITRSVQVGRSLERFLAMPSLYPYRSYGNLDSFAHRLYAALGGTL
jgi:glyoxylase-like metal-dependent hydrolase (beta-lactamase superfamily II)